MRKIVLLLCMLPLIGWAADRPLEIIALQHRSAEQILPMLQPVLVSGGSLSGFGNRLFVRTTAANLAELRAVLAELDVPPVRLLISVRQGAAGTAEGQGVEVQGSIRAGRVDIGSAGGDGRVEGSLAIGARQSARESRSDALQQLQTVDGATATIHTGVSLPVPLRRVWLGPDGAVISEGVIWRDLGTGFVARPQIAGGRVTIDITPYDEQPLGRDGSAGVRRLETTVEGALGEWIPLGASAQAARHAGRALGGFERDAAQGRSEVWLKVERLE